MKCGLYSNTGGMLTSTERLNITANNLANFSTAGYKSDTSFEQTIKFLEEGPYPGKDQPVVGGTAINMAHGIPQTTGRPLDLAFQGEGFFTIQTANGQQLFTRNGAFTLNTNKELVNSDGNYVLDKFNKKISIVGEKVQITPQGEITIDGNYYTTMKIVDLPNRNDIEKVGNTFFKMKDPKKTPNLLEQPDIVSGALERSNVDLMAGITETMAAQRTFDAQRTVADLIFRNIRKTITDIPRPS